MNRKTRVHNRWPIWLLQILQNPLLIQCVAGCWLIFADMLRADAFEFHNCFRLFLLFPNWMMVARCHSTHIWCGYVWGSVCTLQTDRSAIIQHYLPTIHWIFLSHFNGVQKKLISNLITIQFLVYLCGKSALEFHSAEIKKMSGNAVFTIISVFPLFIQ